MYICIFFYIEKALTFYFEKAFPFNCGNQKAKSKHTSEQNQGNFGSVL